MGKTVTDNTFNNTSAKDDDVKVARSLGGAHPKSQPPAPSPFASGPSGGSGPLTSPALPEDDPEE